MDNFYTLKNKKYYIIAIFLLLFLILFCLLILLKYSNVCSKINSKSLNKNQVNLDIEKVKDATWYISIPKIGLDKVLIAEGTDDYILNTYVGHFKETDLFNGNVCLAAHNRGNKVNYFEKLKELEIGDVICYNCKEGYKEYQVESKKIIDVYDFSCMERVNSKNVITLITCVENNPNKRLCIRGIERSI